MAHSYVAYIDESGDDGLSNFRKPGANGGSSHWLCISACILRESQRLETVGWRDQIKQTTSMKSKGRDIHFTKFNHGQKRVACQIIASKSLRFIAVLADKTRLDAATFGEKNRLYFYLTRHVIERLSWFCRDQRAAVPEGDGRVRIVFSRRGGLSYEGFQDYLRGLNSEQATTIHWPVIDIDGIEAKDHSTDAGLQLADCGASAIAAAFEPDPYGNCEAQYAHVLRDVVYSRKGNFLAYGLKILPSASDAALSEQQRSALLPFKKKG